MDGLYEKSQAIGQKYPDKKKKEYIDDPIDYQINQGDHME